MKNRRLSRRASVRLPKHSRAQIKSNPPAPANPAKPPLVPRWLVLVLCMFLAGGGAWAATEHLLFSKLPPELVGKWVVQGGPQDGATFDFFRGGSMVARLNNNGTEVLLEARAAVEGKTLLTTTRNPNTRRDETNKSTIRELTRHSLILETERGEVFRMFRAE